MKEMVPPRKRQMVIENSDGMAIISKCGAYRYVLRRNLHIGAGRKRILFVMLNPSVANATEDDPTVRRCLGFARRERCTEMSIVNLFAYRATDPKALRLVSDPVGPENNEHLAREVADHWGSLVVAAWGVSRFARNRAEQVMAICGPFVCLGLTKDGSPRHPLFTPAGALFIPYEGAAQ